MLASHRYRAAFCPAVLLALLLLPAISRADGLEVRFCPAGQVRTYPLESQRGLNLLLLHNAAVLNRSAVETEVLDCDLQLLRGGQVIDSRKIAGEDLARHVHMGEGIQASGMLQLMGFQFAGLFPEGTRLAGPLLKPGEAMLLTYEAFSFYGSRDQLRLIVHGRTGKGAPVVTSAVLPVSTAPSKTAYRFPLKGRYYVAVGPTPHTEHRWARPEQFGYDIVVLGEGESTHRGSGARFADYYAYGAEVMAVADGRVVGAASDRAEDTDTFRRPAETDDAYIARVQALQIELLQHGGAVGNYVMIDHGNGEFSLYAHLQPGSVQVRAGDAVVSGQVIGRLGGSGNSTEPHLHFQVCDGPDPLDSNGIPVSFVSVSVPFASAPRELQSGDIVEAK